MYLHRLLRLLRLLSFRWVLASTRTRGGTNFSVVVPIVDVQYCLIEVSIQCALRPNTPSHSPTASKGERFVWKCMYGRCLWGRGACTSWHVCVCRIIVPLITFHLPQIKGLITQDEYDELRKKAIARLLLNSWKRTRRERTQWVSEWVSGMQRRQNRIDVEID